MPVGIGDYCIQDDCISKVIGDTDECNKTYCYDYLTSWFIDTYHRYPLTVEEYINVVNGLDFKWPDDNGWEVKSFLREAWLYAIKNSYGIDLTE